MALAVALPVTYSRHSTAARSWTIMSPIGTSKQENQSVGDVRRWTRFPHVHWCCLLPSYPCAELSKCVPSTQFTTRAEVGEGTQKLVTGVSVNVKLALPRDGGGWRGPKSISGSFFSFAFISVFALLHIVNWILYWCIIPAITSRSTSNPIILLFLMSPDNVIAILHCFFSLKHYWIISLRLTICHGYSLAFSFHHSMRLMSLLRC